MGPAVTSTAAPAVRRPPLIAAMKLLGFAAIVAFALRFFLRDALPYLISYTEATYGQFWPRSARLYLHVVGGGLALLLGPLQFWTGLRRQHMRLHQWIGRTYIGGVVVGSGAGLWLAFTSQAFPGYSWNISLGVLALGWMLTTGMALASILARKITLHKEWMVRSYVLTFGFAVFRFLVDAPFMAFMAPPDRYPTSVWLAWVVPLLLVEAVMQGRKLRA